jgi:hypothetical protein
MTLSHNANRLYSNPNYVQGGFTPFKSQEGFNGLGDVNDVLGGASPDQVSAAQVENMYATNPYLNPTSIQSVLSGSWGTLLIAGGVILGAFLIKGRR